MSALASIASTSPTIEQNTTIDTFISDATTWIESTKAEIVKTDYLARLTFDIKMIKWIRPSERAAREEPIADSTEGEKRSYEHMFVEIKPLDGKSLNGYYLEDQIKHISEFVSGARSFGVVFEISTYGASDYKFGALSLLMTKPGDRDLSKVQARTKKVGGGVFFKKVF